MRLRSPIDNPSKPVLAIRANPAARPAAILVESTAEIRRWLMGSPGSD
jgi:hypothetical protein